MVCSWLGGWWAMGGGVACVVNISFRGDCHVPTNEGKALSWWRHQIESLLALCEGNSPITGEFSSQRPVTRSFDVFFNLCLSKQLSKQSGRRWFETPSCSLWRHFIFFSEIRLLPCFFIDIIQAADETGGFNIKMSAYQYRDPHVKDNTVSRPSYL